jgi:hypothetical protein
MTCAMSEEDAVRQLPSTLRVFLDARLQYVHAVMIAQPELNESPQGPQSCRMGLPPSNSGRT